MKKVKFIRTSKIADFEFELNKFLEEIDGCNLIDIKHSSAYDGREDAFTALVIYEV